MVLIPNLSIPSYNPQYLHTIYSSYSYFLFSYLGIKVFQGVPCLADFTEYGYTGEKTTWIQGGEDQGKGMTIFHQDTGSGGFIFQLSNLSAQKSLKEKRESSALKL